MNIIDFFLNNKFTTEYDGGLNSKTKTKTISMNDLKKVFDINDIIENSCDYKGEHYKELVEIILENGKYDIAMNVALINRDYKLCETIHIERQKALINKNSNEQTSNNKKSSHHISRNDIVRDNMKNMINPFSPFNDIDHNQFDFFKKQIELIRSQLDESMGLIDEQLNEVEPSKLINNICEMNFDDKDDVSFMNFLSNINEDAIDPHPLLIDTMKKFFPDNGIKFYFFDEEGHNIEENT